MTSSNNAVASFRVTSITPEPFTVCLTFSRPTILKIRISPDSASILNLPSRSVIVPVVVFSIMILAPGNGLPSSSVTVPETVCFVCADNDEGDKVRARNSIGSANRNMLLVSKYFLIKRLDNGFKQKRKVLKS